MERPVPSALEQASLAAKPVSEALAEAFEGFLHAPDVDQVAADANDHATPPDSRLLSAPLSVNAGDG
jgi:hypothetical protein